MQAKRDYPLFKSIQLINHDYSKTQLLNINLNQLSNKNRISKLLEKINSTSKIRDNSLSQRDSSSDISSIDTALKYSLYFRLLFSLGSEYLYCSYKCAILVKIFSVVS